MPQHDRPIVEIDGNKVKKIREEKGLTQLYVATVVGVTTDTISRWENRKYPSIKRENGEKLAQALEVDLEAIVDQQEHAEEPREQSPEEGPEEQDSPIPEERDFFSKKLLIRGAVALLLAGLALLILFTDSEREPPVQATAMRILPDHAPAGGLFPVIIKITVENGGPFSLIVKEELPEGCRAMEGVPPFNAAGGGNRVLKWVSRVQGTVDLTYLVKAPEDAGSAGAKALEGFKGEIVVGSKAASTAIAGDGGLQLAPYHWVDQDRNGIIDDEEILAFYDLFSEVKNLGVKRDLIDEIWASRGYRWDTKSRQYTILP